MLKYDTEQRQKLLAELEARGTPLDSIRSLFTMLVEHSSEDASKRGCFLVNTALGMPGHDEEVQLLVAGAIEDFRRFFERLIEHGKVRGEIPATVDTGAAASGLLAGFIGIRVMARGAGSEEVMRQAAEQALRLMA